MIENVSVSDLFVAKSEKANLPKASEKPSPLVWVEGGVYARNIAIEKIYLQRGEGENVTAVVVEDGAVTENLTVRDVFESVK